VSKIENLLKNYNKLTNNKGAGRLSPQRDAIVRETHTEHLVRVSLEHDKPDFISGKKTFIAVVVKDLEPEKGPRLGSTAEYVYSNLSVDGTKQFRHCLAMVPDVHDLVTPVPEDMSSQADNTNPKNYIPLTMAAYFYTFKPISEGLKVGAIIEVEFNDNEYDEGTIISVIEPAPVDTLADTEVDQNGDGTNVGDTDGSETGDSAYYANTSNSEKCEIIQPATGARSWTNKERFADQTCGGSTNAMNPSIVYESRKCEKITLATGQVVWGHPKFLQQLDGLVKDLIADQDIQAAGYQLTITSTLRDLSTQRYLREKACKTAINANRLSKEQAHTLPWRTLVSEYQCTGVECAPAVSKGVGHLAGLAVDFQIDCTTGNGEESQKGGKCYEFIKSNSLLFKKLQQYAPKYYLQNYIKEPWHWDTTRT
jgi:hypothetical protein